MTVNIRKTIYSILALWEYLLPAYNVLFTYNMPMVLKLKYVLFYLFSVSFLFLIWLLLVLISNVRLDNPRRFAYSALVINLNYINKSI